MSEASLALSRTFLEQLQKMPPKVHKKVLSFIDSFRADPRAATHHVEPIQSFKDPRARTARIGDDYRAVLVAPKTGTQFLLVYIDHHDEAMRWAENKTFDVHPVLGSLQIVDVESAADAVAGPSPAEKQPDGAAAPAIPPTGAAFRHLSDEDLVALGLPAPLIPAVRQVGDVDGFRRLAPHLPEESREALEWVAVAGGSFAEAKELVKAAERPPQDVDDYGPALEQADTQRRFVSVRSADELEAMLRGPLHAWRIFLHPDQRALVAPKHEYKGPVRVLGGAGTGKTVVAMHRAKYLADEVFTAPGDRVLFTTFSRNLALSVRQNMTLLCDGEEHPRIEVRSIDSWAATYLRPFDITFKLANERDSQRLWQEAIALVGLDRFTEGFCRQEWEQVVQAQDVSDEATYLRVPRKGRGGGRLSRDDRKFLWSLFATYRELLERDGMHEYTDMIRAARKHLQASGAPPPYKAVVVDETQDFDAEKLKLVRALAADGSGDLFLVGDAHQRIYTHPTTLSSCGIDIRGRGKRLRVNYRTTHEIRQFAVGILQGTQVDDLDGGSDDLKGYTSVLSGPVPEVRWYDSEADETAAVVARVAELRELNNDGRGICIIAPSRHAVEKTYATALAAAGIETRIIDRDDEMVEEPGVRLCTMHRAKGLEFEHVIVAGLGDARFPRPVDDVLRDDAVAVKTYERTQRALLFVAATRARDTLHVAGWGAPSSLQPGGVLLGPVAGRELARKTLSASRKGG